MVTNSQYDTSTSQSESTQKPEEILYSTSGRPIRQATLNKTPPFGSYAPSAVTTMRKKKRTPSFILLLNVGTTIKKADFNPGQYKFRQYDPKLIQRLHREHPDMAQTSSYNIDVNDSFYLASKTQELGPIMRFTLIEDGDLLLTYSIYGYVSVYIIDTNGGLDFLKKFSDPNEDEIDEFHVGVYTGDETKHLIVGGKRKHRHAWSDVDNDNQILPCHIKIFDLVNNRISCVLRGHEEEITSLQLVVYEDQKYLLSGSQDGTLIRWRLNHGFTEVMEKLMFPDLVTCMNFTISFLPNCGSRLFAVASDFGFTVWDFHSAKKVQVFEHLFTNYCDYLSVVPYNQEGGDYECYMLVRGVETWEDDEAAIPNQAHLYHLIYPQVYGAKFEINLIQSYSHKRYNANQWPLRLKFKDLQVFLPTIDGTILRLDARTGKLIQSIEEHVGIVRDILCHPSKPFMFTCSDDGVINVFKWDIKASELDVVA